MHTLPVMWNHSQMLSGEDKGHYLKIHFSILEVIHCQYWRKKKNKKDCSMHLFQRITWGEYTNLQLRLLLNLLSYMSKDIPFC